MKSVCVAFAMTGFAQAASSALRRRLQADMPTTEMSNEQAESAEEEPSLYAALGVEEPVWEEEEDAERRRSTGDVQVCVKVKYQGWTYHNVQGLTVKCYDEDDANSDDYMFTMTTGSNGCARKRYTDDGWDDYDYWSYADLYCEVSSSHIRIMPFVTHVSNNHKASNGFGTTITTYVDRVKYNTTGQKPNGCSDSDVWAPIWSALSNMGPVCNQHDLCYANCHETQAACDAEFLELMASRCRKLFSDSGSNYGVCRHIMSNLMHAGVNSQLGTDAYNASQRNCNRG